MAFRRSLAVLAALVSPLVAQNGEFPDCAQSPVSIFIPYLCFSSQPTNHILKLASNGVCDTSLDPWTRARAVSGADTITLTYILLTTSQLVEAMTLDEKIANSIAESPGIPRLGLPKYTWWNEALHGVARSRGISFNPSGEFSYATSFPQPITMGAAFDMPMIEQFAGKAVMLEGSEGLDVRRLMQFRGHIDRGASF